MENSAAETEVVLIDDPEDTVAEVPIQLRHPSRVFPRVPRSVIARLVIVPSGPSHTSSSYPLKRSRNQVKPAFPPAPEPVKRVKAAATRQKPEKPGKPEKPEKPVKAAALPPQKKATNKFLEKPQPLPKPAASPINTKPGALGKKAASASAKTEPSKRVKSRNPDDEEGEWTVQLVRLEIKTLQKYKRKREESDEEEEEEYEEDVSEDNSEDDDTWVPEKCPPKSKRFQNNIAENKWKPSPQSKIHATSKTEKSTGPLKTGSGEGTHPCPECGIVFYQKATLIKHLTIHEQQKLLGPGKREEAIHNNSNKKALPLSKTLKNQNDKPALQDNKSVPNAQINTTGKKPNPCTECEKSFNCPLMLKKHLNVHEQERQEKMARAEKIKAKSDKIETNEKSEKPNKMSIKNEKSNVNNEKKNLNEKTNVKANEKIEKTNRKPEEAKGNVKDKTNKTIEQLEKIKEKNKVNVEKTETKQKNERFKTEKIEKSIEKNGKKPISTGEHRKKDEEAEKKSSCNVCGKTFTKISLLIVHRRIHTGYFSCKECGKSFSALSNLKVHQMKHKGSKSAFSCKECGKSFKIASYLQAHKRVHTLEKFRDTKKGNRKKNPLRNKL